MLNEKVGIFTYKDESYDFSFRTSLSAFEKLVFVRNVVDAIVNDDNYDVVIKDLIFDFNIIEFFTNVDTSFVEMKDEDGNEINKIILIEHFLNESDVVDVVKENVDKYVLDELSNAIDLNIQYRTGINAKSLNNSLVDLISTLNEKIESSDLDYMMNMAEKFAGMTDDFTMENLVNAYMNSDIHKENLKEIKEAKEKSNAKSEVIEEITEVKEEKKATKKKKEKEDIK